MEELNDIRTHIEMMLDDEMKEHCGFRPEYDLNMQIFRILQGYRKALDDAGGVFVPDRNE